jgi:hypothetical protein
LLKEPGGENRSGSADSGKAMGQDRPAVFVLRTDEGQDWPEIRRRLEVGRLNEEVGVEP